VIQPQVPYVTCYDLVPIDHFVFGACPLAVWRGDFGRPDLSCLRACVQGSEHIHRQCC